jgi:hypothetical protein
MMGPDFSVERMAAGGTRLRIRGLGVRRHRSPSRYVLLMWLMPTARPSWVFSFFRPLVVVGVVVLVVTWFCTLAFYVRPAWLSGIASYGIYWRHAMPPTVHYVLVGLWVAMCVFAGVGECIARQAHGRLRIVALVCAIVGLITAMVIPILEPAW